MRNDRPDKYGRGSAAANGKGFVDLAPGDTFDGLEAQLRARIAEVYVNHTLGISASIGSNRNANELAKHMAPGEGEEVHKFAAKNVGALFEHGKLGILHFDKKAIRDDSPKPVMLRVFSRFVFDGLPFLSTITLRAEKVGNKLYAVQSVDITKDADSERTPRGETAPFQNLASFLAQSIAYYVGECNRTRPKFVNRSEPFTIPRAAELLTDILNNTSNLCLRRAEPRDIRAVFELSNDPVLRANLIHPEHISWETHVAWFNKAIADSDTIFFVAEMDGGDFVGQVRFSRRDGHWVVSISIVPTFRGRGLTKSLLCNAMSHIPHGTFVAEIAVHNEASKRLFLSAGFTEKPSLNAPHGFQTFVKESDD